jgi:hypothetical protein
LEEEVKNLDLSAKSFDEFVVFFFDREVIESDPPSDSFVADFLQIGEYDESVPSSPETVIQYMTTLFSNFAKIGAKYSLAQLDQRLWNLLGVRFELYDLLWDSSLPIELRKRCICSMYVVYSDFVSTSQVDPMVTIFDMCWDLLGDGFWNQRKLFEAGVERGEVTRLDSDQRGLLDVMLETLVRILELPDARTQNYALHGLGHLHHPGARRVVQEYIDKNKSDFTEPGLRWVEQCRDGTVM